MLLARINPVCGRAIERKRSCVCDLHDDIRIHREQRGHRTAACEQSCKRLQRNFLLHGVHAECLQIICERIGQGTLPVFNCFMPARVNAEESYRGDIPDADCVRVRAKGGSCQSELPVILSCPYRGDDSISYISCIEERVFPLSVVPREQYLHYLCSCVPDTVSMIRGISPVVLAVSPVVEP